MGKESELLQLVKVEDVAGVSRLLNKLRANKPKLLGTGRRMNINAQDADGMCALHQTALLGNAALMSLLLESGAAVDVRDARGMRPLHFAAWQGYAPLVTLLLQWNSSVNEGAADGSAPLHLAAQYGHVEVARALLLRFHANPALRNNQHRTPFDLAAEFGRLQIVELFLSSNKCLGLLEESAEDTLDNGRTTCLHLAAKNGHLDVIRALLRSGMNVNRTTLRGTALHEAALYGRFEVVKLLIESGVDVNKPNSYDQTALDIFRTMTSSSRAGRDIRQLLQEACSAVQAVSLKDHHPSAGDSEGLALREGDYVTVLEQKEDGRWRGVVFGENGTSRSGYFPSAAVALLNRQVGGMSSGSQQQQQQRPKSSLAKKVAPPVVPGHNPRPAATPPSGNHGEVCDAGGMYISMSSGSCTSSPVYSTTTTPSHHVAQVFMSPRGQPNSPHPNDEGSISSSVSSYASSLGCYHPLVPPPAYQQQTSVETDQGIDVQSPGRDSPSSSGSSSGSGCRHSITSLDSGRASSSAYDGCSRGVAYAANQHQQQQQRLSVHSYESSTSLRQSYHSSTSSLGSMDRVLDENTPTSPNYSPAQINVSKLLRDGVPEPEVLRRWLCEQRFEEYFHLFIQSGYDIPTISRMTPEDLTAIGITNPSHRKKLKVEIGKLNVSDGLPDFIPVSLDEWLRLLRLEEYAVCLQQQGYNKVAEVQGIAWEDLEEIGIQRLGHQKKIMLAIKRLKDIQSGIKRFSCTSGGGTLSEFPSRPAQPLEVKCQVISPPNIPFQQPYIECGGSDSPLVVLSGATTPNAYASPSHLIYRPDIVAIQVRHPSGARSLENLEENNREMRHQTFLQTTDNNNRWSANNHNNLLLNQTVSFQVNTNSGGAPLGVFQGGAPQVAWRRGSLDDGDLTPTNEFMYEVEGGGTLPRPKVSIKPRPVAKIMAKTRLPNGEGGDGATAVLVRSEETNEVEDLKGGVESCVTIAEVHNSPRRSMTGINSSPCTFRNGKKVPPPPPPKRSNSMNEKHQQQRASSADYSNEQLFATCVKSMASKFGLSTRKSQRPDSCGGEDVEIERKAVESPGTPSDEGSDLSLEISEAPDRTPPSPAPGSPVHLRSHRASPFLNKRNESTSSLASTNSSGSNSSSSGGSSETGSAGATNLPFANENVGTIKQRAIKPHPPLTKIDLGPRLSNPNNAVTPRSAPVTPKRRSSLKSCDMTPSVVVTPPPPVSDDRERSEELDVGVASGDVLSDIDNMLANLSEELDAMLTSQLSE